VERLIVDSAHNACILLDSLFGYAVNYDGPVALDTETTGCNPKKEGPVGKARLWCMTLAWGDTGCEQSAYVPREWLPAFKAWLECDRYPKVGQNIYGYDRHVLANEGLRLRGIVGDTQRMSKLLNPANDAGHGLKDQARRLGFEMTDYEDVVGKKESIEELWADPERRQKFIEYACRDAVATLAVYRDNATRLKGVKW
jgi:DNA polymerase-1